MTPEQREKIEAFLHWHDQKVLNTPCVRRHIVKFVAHETLYGTKPMVEDYMPACLMLRTRRRALDMRQTPGIVRKDTR